MGRSLFPKEYPLFVFLSLYLKELFIYLERTRTPNPLIQENIAPDAKTEASKNVGCLCFMDGMIPKTAPRIPPDMAPHLKPCFIR